MDYKINDKPKSQKEIEVTIQPEEIKKYLEKVAEKLSLDTKIKGFRPGKAPLGIVQEMLGKEKVWQEACYEAINKNYPEIIKKENIDVISSPEISVIKMVSGQALEYKATVAIFPIITIPANYKEKAKNILKEKKEINVSDDEVNNMIDTIRKTRAKIVRVLRESRTGDEDKSSSSPLAGVRVGDEMIINFQGKINGVAQENLKGDKVPIIIGEENKSSSSPLADARVGETKFINGFIEKITGMKENEEKVFSLEVPFNKDFKKQVEFSVKVLAVNERELPELNDDFARSVGDFPGGVEDLKKKIKENIRIEKENREKERLRIKVMEEISKDSSGVEVPDVLIARETNNMLNEFRKRLSQKGGSGEEDKSSSSPLADARVLENYLKNINKTEEKLKEEWKEQAEKRIIISLILQELAKKEEIKVKDEEIEAEVAVYLNARASARGSDENVKKNINIEQLKLYIKDMIQNKKVFELLEL